MQFCDGLSGVRQDNAQVQMLQEIFLEVTDTVFEGMKTSTKIPRGIIQIVFAGRLYYWVDSPTT